MGPRTTSACCSTGRHGPARRFPTRSAKGKALTRTHGAGVVRRQPTVVESLARCRSSRATKRPRRGAGGDTTTISDEERHDMSTVRAIRAGIRKLPKGKPFTSERFLKHGSRSTVDRTLSRLAGQGEVQRLARGVFVRPRTSRFVGAVLPDVLEVVEAIARNNGETVQVHGAEAARRFKLSTQVPTAPVFHTSASSRTIRIANIAVRMVHTSRPSGPAPPCATPGSRTAGSRPPRGPASTHTEGASREPRRRRGHRPGGHRRGPDRSARAAWITGPAADREGWGVLYPRETREKRIARGVSPY